MTLDAARLGTPWSHNNQHSEHAHSLAPFVLHASGWQLDQETPIEGEYLQAGSFHGRPMFAKYGPNNEVVSVVYYWDLRDGVAYAGWCFAPAVSADIAWARHADVSAFTPPRDGWVIPPVNNTTACASFKVTMQSQGTQYPPPWAPVHTAGSRHNIHDGQAWVPGSLASVGRTPHAPGAPNTSQMQGCGPGEQWQCWDGFPLVAIGSTEPQASQRTQSSHQWQPTDMPISWSTSPDGLGRSYGTTPAEGRVAHQVAPSNDTHSQWHDPGHSGQQQGGYKAWEDKHNCWRGGWSHGWSAHGHTGGTAEQAPYGSNVTRGDSPDRDRSRTPDRGTRSKIRQAVKRIYGALKPFGEENDPIYSLKRTGPSSPWPYELSKAGKIHEWQYPGGGYKMFFGNPCETLRKNNKDDFQFVMARIKQETDLEMTDVKVNESGIAQISFGKDKGCGSIQLYLTKNSRADGNVHLNFGPNNVELLKEIRKVLLRSAWFQETAGMYMRPAEKSIEKAMKNDTRVPLFFVTDDTRELELKKFISLIMVQVGMEAKKALLEYYRIHGLEANHIVYTMIDREFRE